MPLHLIIDGIISFDNPGFVGSGIQDSLGSVLKKLAASAVEKYASLSSLTAGKPVKV
jgi:hypothetical protein